MIVIVNKPKTELTYSVFKNETLTLVVLVSGKEDRDVRVEINLIGEHADAKIIGIVIGHNDAKISFQTLQHHKAKNTTSNLLVKAVLSGESFFSYEGGIVVDKVAQKTNAYQRNENLLLDETAHVTSKPALEILANDVRCTHGATIGTLDRDQLWYLATRNISPGESRNLISHGFLLSALKSLDEADKMNIEKEITFYE